MKFCKAPRKKYHSPQEVLYTSKITGDKHTTVSRDEGKGEQLLQQRSDSKCRVKLLTE